MMLELDSKGIFGTEGSGNQKKIWINNYLYKVDTKFRESTKEVSASNFAEAIGISHVKYERLQCKVGGDNRWCCRCKSYLNNSNDKTISLFKIIDYYFPITLTHNTPTIDYFVMTVKAINRTTGLSELYIEQRLLQILTFDFLIANDDRHLSNIDIIMYSNGTFDIAPIFDNGHSFFRKDSVLTNNEIERLSYKFKSKPFSTNQWKNLISIQAAKDYCHTWMNTIRSKYNSIDSIHGISESHKKILKYRINQLLNK